MSKNNSISMASLLARAEHQAQLSDYGETDFLTPLSKLIQCVNEDANLHAVGQSAFCDEIVRNIVNRLRFQRDLKLHPEILDEDVSDPIIIIGLPRSGTTKTQRMIASDPNLLKTAMWQLVNPAPFTTTNTLAIDPRIAAANDGDTIFEEHDKAQAAHHMTAENVDEDWQLFECTLNDWFQYQRTPSNAWHEWVMSRTEPSDLDNYRYVRSLFQYLQWQQGGRLNRRWLMKSCGHLGYLEELLSVYPKATLVHVHRHPKDCLPSYAKVLYEIGGMRKSDMNPLEVGRQALEWESATIKRYLETRDQLKLNHRIVDIAYEQMRADPISAIRAIYQQARLELTNEAEQAMLQWDTDNEQHKHGTHKYSLEEFGLSTSAINHSFADYIERFIN